MNTEEQILDILKKIFEGQEQSLAIQRAAFESQQKAITSQQIAIKNQLATGRIYRIALSIMALFVAFFVYWIIRR